MKKFRLNYDLGISTALQGPSFVEVIQAESDEDAVVKVKKFLSEKATERDNSHIFLGLVEIVQEEKTRLVESGIRENEFFYGRRRS